ncbi:pirin family protein [Alicyclobacillus cycloheptanicus]|uniref:Redox-sensitive bicupin YhaK (Pirin superfamily) n=1 Tax=Alicyclobacillus cycloheptanicus TaxID=1457 RepID=A0ABT9XH67_9BACL|nr:pirin family protein [Alicyclobacillus cycloheptanicus]MDQ0189653.1 redox-sensitive bicupin YhaK (pirin superfamily) [Alicyclobacillus cycloheptanicus]WDL99954.1 pirin family protein [Alicyclobacillus cycloheptanicus]
MISVQRAEERYAAKQDWLSSNFSFSFGPYIDPDNTRFGPMRVLNDDFIAPNRGFGAHPHSDMEVVSIVLKGWLKHQDNLGHVAVTTFGEIQRMSAGTGIVHTESNASETEELNLLQMWFEPMQRGLPPTYEVSAFDVNQLDGRLLKVVSHQPAANVAKIHQDVTIYLSRLQAGEAIPFEGNPHRKVFLFVVEGALRVNETTVLQTRDAARMEGESGLTLAADEASFFMLIDLP